MGNNGNFSWIEIELRFWKKMILAMRETCHQTVITVDYTKQTFNVAGNSTCAAFHNQNMETTWNCKTMKWQVMKFQMPISIISNILVVKLPHLKDEAAICSL